MEKSFAAKARTMCVVFAGAVLLTVGSAMAIGKVGEMAADWSGLKDLDGKTCNLSDYKGKVLLIMTVQHNCGGCLANAPRVGQIAKKFEGPNFQAIGSNINKGNAAQIKTFETELKSIEKNIDFPLLTGLVEPAIINENNVSRWAPYDALRDVFFIIDHTGKIVGRVDGNRSDYMGDAKYKQIEDAITAALTKIPSTTIATSGNLDLCLRACKRQGVFQIDLDPQRNLGSKDIDLRILDPQGRVIRTLDWARAGSGAGSQAIWDGMDSRGKAVAWGSYFLNANAPGSSVTMLLSWVP